MILLPLMVQYLADDFFTLLPQMVQYLMILLPLLVQYLLDSFVTSSAVFGGQLCDL